MEYIVYELTTELPFFSYFNRVKSPPLKQGKCQNERKVAVQPLINAEE